MTEETKFVLVCLAIFACVMAAPYIYWFIKIKTSQHSISNSSHDSNIKERPPKYELVDVEFNKVSRNTKATFRQIIEYRTVERYVQKNYVKYPVLSGWKTKTKKIEINLKLTNFELETLKNNPERLVRLFASDIVARIRHHNIDLPSWYLKEYAQKQFQQRMKEVDNRISNAECNLGVQISSGERSIKETKEALPSAELSLEKQKKRENKIRAKFKKRKNNQSKRLASKLDAAVRKTQELQNAVDSLYSTIAQIEDKIKEATERTEKIKREAESQRKEYQTEYRNTLGSIVVLGNDAAGFGTRETFVPLKSLSGYEYKKIIGCYVIRNTKNGKCYVGQSKDIIRRLRQHFNGTEPKNMVFAEDYFTCKATERENLFEFCIFECETKDELDRKERELIKEYDARVSGYNQTQGNK